MGLTLELEPDVIGHLSTLDHLPQLVAILPRGQTQYELLLEHQVLVVGVELAIVWAEERHAWCLRGGLLA